MHTDEASYFKAYSRFWHPVALAKELGDKPVPVTLLGRSLLVWRSSSQVHVTGRYCAHRGTDLKAAHVEADGLRCCFHGWKYGGDGRCVHVPQLKNGGPAPEKARIPSYRTAERYGLVWTCLGGEPLVSLPEWPQLEGNNAVAALPPLDWKTSAGRAVENFLDLGHLSWVHRGTFGNPDYTEVAPYDIERLPHGFRYHSQYMAVSGARPDGTRNAELCLGTYDLTYPFCAKVHFRPTKRAFSEHHFFLAASPAAIDKVRGFFFVSYDRSLRGMIDRFAKAEYDIQQQDREFLELQIDPIHRIDASAEVHCDADKVHVEYRSGLRELTARAHEPPLPHS